MHISDWVTVTVKQYNFGNPHGTVLEFTLDGQSYWNGYNTGDSVLWVQQIL
jgi:hypothetical protein